MGGFYGSSERRGDLYGAYQAPDWSADWLHKELVAFMDIKAQERFGAKFDALSDEQKAQIKALTKAEYRTNTVKDGTVKLSDDRLKAMAVVKDEYMGVFGNDPRFKKLREDYAMKENTLANEQHRAELVDFIFWTAWAVSTDRPSGEATYTNNWPHEPLIDNVPTTENVVWTIASLVILLTGIGLLVWFGNFYGKKDEDFEAPAKLNADPIAALALTPSQKALGKYLFVAIALFAFQAFIGGFVAHYTIEGQSFFGLDISQYIPYSLARTWHVQASIFWIATGFLAAGLFLAPIINGGKDPKFQKLGVDVLFYALLFLVVGSFAGEYMAIAGKMDPSSSFWIGHQGYEYLDLGRIWQLILFVGLVIWMCSCCAALSRALEPRAIRIY